MFISKYITLSDTQRALLFKGKQFKGILNTGQHHFWHLSNIEVITYDITKSVGIPVDKRLQFLMEIYPELFAEHLQHVSTEKGEIALIYQHKNLLHIVPESSDFALWKALSGLSITKYNVDEQPSLPDEINQAIHSTKSLEMANSLTYKITLSANERALVFKDNQLVQVLNSGHYRYWDQDKNLSVETVVTDAPLSIKHDARLLQLAEQNEALFADHIMQWSTQDNEVGLIYRNQVLRNIIAPGQQGMYWRGNGSIEIKKMAIETDTQQRIESGLAQQLRQPQDALLRQSAEEAIYHAEVTENHIGFLWINGKLEETLSAGTYAWWSFNRNISVKLLDMRLQNMAINGQEILTKDRVSLRINLSATWQVSDAETLVKTLADHQDHLYRELQLALRAVVSTRTLDQLLEDKNLLNKEVLESVTDKVQCYGIDLQGTGVKDIILPGEMKEILTQVVEAQKVAEANLIRRREETQATRSLHNTAKLMDGNPTLLRLKELEILERVIGGVNTLNVYGGLDGVMNDMVRLNGKP